ncbi:MAG TPA: phosphatase PAP2 family protein [Solirubrobacteraceae bacterium]|nr:phosphatase PAP2 family protein [Solirubrobacteraceae bacterium]
MEKRHPSRPAIARTKPSWLSRALIEAGRIDLAVYSAIAETPTPSLDLALRRLSRAANYSRLSIASAAVLSVGCGPRGREAAKLGLASVFITSAILNLGVKPVFRRRRPDRAGQHVPRSRRVRMPSSTAFPSGHSASAFAFATGVGQELPAAGFPLRALATAVAYSRVHTGVHYPSDVIAGALVGSALAQATARALDQLRPTGHDCAPTVS